MLDPGGIERGRISKNILQNECSTELSLNTDRKRFNTATQLVRCTCPWLSLTKHLLFIACKNLDSYYKLYIIFLSKQNSYSLALGGGFLGIRGKYLKSRGHNGAKESFEIGYQRLQIDLYPSTYCMRWTRFHDFWAVPVEVRCSRSSTNKQQLCPHARCFPGFQHTK